MRLPRPWQLVPFLSQWWNSGYTLLFLYATNLCVFLFKALAIKKQKLCCAAIAVAGTWIAEFKKSTNCIENSQLHGQPSCLCRSPLLTAITFAGRFFALCASLQGLERFFERAHTCLAMNNLRKDLCKTLQRYSRNTKFLCDFFCCPLVQPFLLALS